MSRSRRLRILEKSLDALRSHFLPQDFSPVGEYGDKEYALAEAYVLLAHAEFESYIEDRIREKVQSAQETWANKGRFSPVAAELLRYHCQKEQPWKPVDTSQDKVQAAFNSFLAFVSNNNGIKEEAVCRMLYAIGIKHQSLDAVWLANMNSFGHERGMLAHTSIKIRQRPDPKDINDKVEVILTGLRDLDKKIARRR